MEKYRINALAKDFNIKSKEIIDILTANGYPGRSHMTALEADELSIVFEYITQNNQTDITAFFNYYDEKKKAKKEAEEAKKRAEMEELRKKAGIAAPADQPAKQKQKQIQVKEVKLRPGTDENDYQIKLRNLIKFLNEGDKAKVTLRFRGREMAHQEFGMRQLERVKNDLEEIGQVEQMPKMEGRQMIMVIAPKKKH